MPSRIDYSTSKGVRKMRKIPNFDMKGIDKPILAMEHNSIIYINLLKGNLSFKQRGQRDQYFPIANLDVCQQVNKTGVLPPPKRGVKILVHQNLFRSHPRRKDLICPEIVKSYDEKSQDLIPIYVAYSMR